MIASGNMTAELQALWDRKTAEQKAVDRLTSAVNEGRLEALQVGCWYEGG